jgi:hypothetical protein
VIAWRVMGYSPKLFEIGLPGSVAWSQVKSPEPSSINVTRVFKSHITVQYDTVIVGGDFKPRRITLERYRTLFGKSTRISSFLFTSALQDLLLGQQQEALSRQTGRQQQQQQWGQQQQQQDPISLLNIAQQLLRQGGIATLHQKGLREFISTVQQLSGTAVGASVPELVQLVLETVPKLSDFIRDRKKKQRQKERNADEKGAEGGEEGTEGEDEEGEETDQPNTAGDGGGAPGGGGFTTARAVHQQQQQQSGPSSSGVAAASGDTNTATAAATAGDSGVADGDSSSDAGDDSDAVSDDSSEPGEGVLPGATVRPDVVSGENIAQGSDGRQKAAS